MYSQNQNPYQNQTPQLNLQPSNPLEFEARAWYKHGLVMYQNTSGIFQMYQDRLTMLDDSNTIIFEIPYANIKLVKLQVGALFVKDNEGKSHLIAFYDMGEAADNIMSQAVGLASNVASGATPGIAGGNGMIYGSAEQEALSIRVREILYAHNVAYEGVASSSEYDKAFKRYIKIFIIVMVAIWILGGVIAMLTGYSGT